MANEQAKATIYLDGKQAEAALDGLKARAKSLRDELKRAEEAGDQIKTKKLQSEIKGVEAAQRSLRKETFEYEKVLRNINGASMSELKKALRTVEVQLNKMSRTDPGYAAKAAQAKLLRTEINRVNTSLRAQPAFMSRAAEGFNKYFTMITAGIATITGIIFSVKEFVKGMVGLDDQLADVMKTTGMARNEVRELYQDFKTFNTRTPRRELLALAEEAGRLGKNSKQDVMDFVEVANQIKVALGDDLGGEAEVAIREVGKLTEIYKVGEEYGTGFKESMLKVGSAINEVSANSNAQAPYLIDYLKRMGGIAGQMDVNSAQVIGYASALDQLGQTQEMAATAQGKIMVDMFKDQAKYAAIAKMSTAEFSALLKTDANEAFLKLLEGLNGNNEGFSVMAGKLDELGVDGARAVQVLSVLSANTKMVREQQALANKAMNEGISLTNEYNIKNNNLAGSVEKIGQFLHSKFINSSFLGWMEKVVGKVSEWTEIKLYDTLKKEQSELNLLVASIQHAANTQETRNKLIEELQRKYPDFLKNIDTEKLTNEQLASRLREVNEEYENKILLAIKEDALKGNYKERLQLKLDELEAIKNIAKYEDIAAKARQKVGTETDPKKLRSLLTDQEIAALNAMDLLPKKLENIRSRMGQLIADEVELNNAILGLQTKVPAGAAPGTVGTGGSGGTGSTGGTTPTGTVSGGGTDWKSILAPAEENPINTAWIDAQMLADAELFAEKKRSEEEWTEFLKAQIEERTKAELKALDIEKEIADARQDLKDIQVAAIGELAGTLAGMFEQGSAAQIAMIAVEKAIAIAQIWMNLAKEKSLINVAAAQMSTIPVVGPGLAASYTAAMTAKAVAAAKINTGLILAQAVTTAISSKKREKTQAYAHGKYPGLQTGMYGDKPHYALFNEVPGLPEMVVDGLTTKRLQVNHPEIVKAIYEVRDGHTPGGYANGKYPATNSDAMKETEGKGLTNKILTDLTMAINEFMKHRPPVYLEEFEKKWNAYNDTKTKRNLQ